MRQHNQGEGNYKAARRYNKRLQKDLESNLDVERSAEKAAAALDGDEADILARAEGKGKEPLLGED